MVYPITTTEPTRIVIKLPALQKEIEIAQDWLVSRDAIVAKAAAITKIESNAAYDEASFLLSQITKASNAMEDMRKQLSKPFTAAASCIKDAADEARQPLEDIKAALKSALAAYAEAQRKAQEAERKRIEAEQRAEIERQHAEQEAQRVAAEELGVEESPEEKVFTPVVTVPAPTIQAPRSSAARIVEKITWSIVDEDKVPRGFMIVDPRRINDHVRTHGDHIKQSTKDGQGSTLIPGIKFEITTDVSAR